MSTNTLKVDPPERPVPWVVTLNFSLSNPAPPTMARTAPVPGSTDTTAPVALRGAPVAVSGARGTRPVGVPSGAISASTSLRAAVAIACAFGSRVVWMRRPPRNTRFCRSSRVEPRRGSSNSTCLTCSAK